MKKLITISTIFLTCNLASAQIQLTSALGYMPGDAYQLQSCVALESNLGASGANVNVNLANLTPSGSPLSANFTQVAGTPYAGTYPSATVVSPVTSTGGTSGYSYYKLTSSRLELVGIATSQYTMVYSDPMMLSSYPMNYGDSVGDIFAASYEANGVLTMRNGWVTMEADAWGTITTPTGTFPYLRVKIEQNIADTFLMMGDIIGFSNSQTISFNYMATGWKTPVYSYSEIYSGFGNSVSASYALSSSGQTALNEQPNKIESVDAYPNPAQDEVNFMLPANPMATQVTVKVADITGKTVCLHDLETANHPSVKLDTKSLTTGLYFAELVADGKLYRSKFMVK